MFFSPGWEQLDPALLAFVKCHVTSPLKWEVLRVLASHEGAWIRVDQLARGCHRLPSEVTQAMADLAADGIVETRQSAAPDGVSYRLATGEPSSVVLRRLIEAARHSQELRAIIAAHLQHTRQKGASLSTTAAA
jgi:hypothetical protein